MYCYRHCCQMPDLYSLGRGGSGVFPGDCLDLSGPSERFFWLCGGCTLCCKFKKCSFSTPDLGFLKKFRILDFNFFWHACVKKIIFWSSNAFGMLPRPLGAPKGLGEAPQGLWGLPKALGNAFGSSQKAPFAVLESYIVC